MRPSKKHPRRLRNAGQSTLEYFIVLSAIIIALIAAAAPGGPISRAIDRMLNAGEHTINDAADQLDGGAP